MEILSVQHFSGIFFETEVPSCGCKSEIHLFSCLNERYSQRQRPSGKQTSTQVEKRVSGKCKARCSGSSARSIHYWIRAILIPMVQTTALFHQKYSFTEENPTEVSHNGTEHTGAFRDPW